MRLGSPCSRIRSSVGVTCTSSMPCWAKEAPGKAIAMPAAGASHNKDLRDTSESLMGRPFTLLLIQSVCASTLRHLLPLVFRPNATLFDPFLTPFRHNDLP